VIAAALLGVFTWTFLEYVIHRFLGHFPRLRENPFGVEHVRHHIEGSYFAPSWKKLVIGVTFSAILCVPAIAIAGRASGIAYVAGLMGFYGVYELLHLEHVHAGVSAYGRWARRHHFHHHFMNARTNHGVTSPLWDLVFGTYERPTLVTIPRKLCVAWLLDPATNDIRAAYQGTFALKR